MQVVNGKNVPFESWYREHKGARNSVKISNMREGIDHGFINDLSMEFDSQSKIETNTKNEPVNKSEISTITSSTVNKVQENITKSEQSNDKLISEIIKSTIDKTQECLAKFEEMDTIRHNHALKLQNRMTQSYK